MSTLSTIKVSKTSSNNSDHPNYNDKSIQQLFTAEHLDMLSQMMQVRTVSAGSFLFWEGDEAHSIYWVRKGLIKLYKTSKDGRDLLLSIAQPQDFIVDLDPWDRTHHFSAEAFQNVEIGVISRVKLEAFMQQDGDFSYRFAMLMSHMQRQMESKLRDLLMSSKCDALASTLIRLSNSFGIMQIEGILLDIKLTNSDLAELIGTTREGANRILSSMKNDQILEQTETGMLRIRSLEKLRRMAGCTDCPKCPKSICKI